MWQANTSGVPIHGAHPQNGACMNAVRHSVIAMALTTTSIFAACGTTTSNSPAQDDDRDVVVELAIRQLNDGQDVTAFEAARDAFIALLRQQDGVEVDREFQAFLDFGAQAPPVSPVFIGMTQYENADAFAAAGQALGTSPEASEFFSTFTPQAFTALRPLDPTQTSDLADIAGAPGQVLEIAVRDLSTYEAFDVATYEAARDSFLALLRDQPGFVAEYQWVSVLDSNTVVGMTVYESEGAFFALLGSESFVNDPRTGAFVFGYPPSVSYVSSVVR